VHFATLRSAASRRKVLRPGACWRAIDGELALLTGCDADRAQRRRRRTPAPREWLAMFDGYLHDDSTIVRDAANASQLLRNLQVALACRVCEMVWGPSAPRA
jgi:hypothetical protein